jgi:hypothetical protein
MRIVGNPGSEDRKKFYAICGFAVVFAAVMYYELSGSSGPVAPPPPPVIISAPQAASSSTTAEGDSSPTRSGSATKVGTTSATLDPTLHMEAMLVTESVVYTGTGRNIFSAQSAPPVAIQKPIAPARPTQVAVVAPVYHPQVPPPPPPIDLKFCGFFASPKTGAKQAILLHGEDVWLASPGDIVLRRYRILSIAANSVEVEDIPNNNKQSLPLLAN